MRTVQTVKDMDTAIRAATAVLTGIASSDFAVNYGTYAAYGVRDYKSDIAADILKAMWGRDIHDSEREYLCHDANWPQLQGFTVINNSTGGD